MGTKRKVSLTIDEDLYADIEDYSKKQGIVKSKLAQEAFRLWIKTENEKLMAKGYEDMYEEDKEIAEMVFESQREVLK